MSDAPALPKFYTSMSAWPVEVRRYAYHLCWERQRDAQGKVGGDGKWQEGGDDAVLEWMMRSRDGVRPMATAPEIWEKFVKDAEVWAATRNQRNEK
jgi:hypothetical protein